MSRVVCEKLAGWKSRWGVLWISSRQGSLHFMMHVHAHVYPTRLKAGARSESESIQPGASSRELAVSTCSSCSSWLAVCHALGSNMAIDPLSLAGPVQQGQGVAGQYVYWMCMPHPLEETVAERGNSQLDPVASHSTSLCSAVIAKLHPPTPSFAPLRSATFDVALCIGFPRDRLCLSSHQY